MSKRPLKQTIKRRRLTCYSALLLLPFWSVATQAEPIFVHKSGQSSLAWMLLEHQGAEGMLEGKACKDCHTAELYQGHPGASRNVDLQLEVTRHHLVVTVTLPTEFTPMGAVQLAVVMGGPNARTFAQVGCWAACHNDMRGMPNDQGYDKYLAVTRKRSGVDGTGALLKSESTLAKLRREQRALEVWQIKLLNGQLKTVWQEALFAERKRLPVGALTVSTLAKPDGQLSVEIKRPVKIGEQFLYIQPGKSYTLTLAILDATSAPPSESLKPQAESLEESRTESDAQAGLNPWLGPEHWVSFPVPFTRSLGD